MVICRKCGAQAGSENCCENGSLNGLNKKDSSSAPVTRRKRKPRSEVVLDKETEVSE